MVTKEGQTHTVICLSSRRPISEGTGNLHPHKDTHLTPVPKPEENIRFIGPDKPSVHVLFPPHIGPQSA